MRVSIDDAEGLPADNERFAVIESRTLPRVLIAAGGANANTGFYFSRALQAHDEEGPEFAVQTVTGAALTAMTPAQVGEFAVVAILWLVYHVTRPADVGLLERLAPERLLPPLGPVLLVLMPSKLLRKEKHAGDYWGLHAAGLAAVALAGAMAEDTVCFALMGLYAVFGVWSLALFFPARATGVVPPIPAGRPAPDAPPPARVVDPEPAVQDHVELLEDLVGRRPRLHHHVGAHRLATGGEGPHVEVVHPAHRRPGGQRGLDLLDVEVGGGALQQHVHGLAEQAPGARQQEERDHRARDGVHHHPAGNEDHEPGHDDHPRADRVTQHLDVGAAHVRVRFY